MKKIVIALAMLLLLVSCTSRSPEDYHIISKNPVDGYDIYEYQHSSLFCHTEYEDIYYSDETYNYGFIFTGCSPDMAFFILKGNEYVYLHDALDHGDITLQSLMPELTRLTRHPEEISTKKADYYWLDFHIGRDVVYVYAGGACGEEMTETFTIGGQDYTYTASGCLKDNLLYMEVDGEFQPVQTLLAEGKINGEYLIPLLTRVSPQ